MPLGIMSCPFKGPLKPLVHHGNIVPSGLSENPVKKKNPAKIPVLIKVIPVLPESNSRPAGK